MPDENASVETARINARQAIVVALVTGLVTIVTTLIATGTIGGTSGAAGDTGQTASAPSVLEAPVQHFSAKPTALGLSACVERAVAGLQGLGLTGIEQGRYFAWGYRDATTGLVWCHTDEGLVIFLAAGRDAAGAAALAEGIRRSF